MDEGRQYTPRLGFAPGSADRLMLCYPTGLFSEKEAQEQLDYAVHLLEIAARQRHSHPDDGGGLPAGEAR